MTSSTELDTWLAEEATFHQQLSQGAGAGLADPEQTRSLSGLDILHRKHVG